MSATPEFLRRPGGVEPPPPDLFTAAAAGAAVAKAPEPVGCCGRFLHLVPIFAVLICIGIAGGINLAIAMGDAVAGVVTPAPPTYVPPQATNRTAQTNATTALPTPPPTTANTTRVPPSP
jgi:hypothetical protein